MIRSPDIAIMGMLRASEREQQECAKKAGLNSNSSKSSRSGQPKNSGS